MKFVKALGEGVEVTSRAVSQDNQSWNKVKAFKVDGKGPFSIFDLTQSSNRIYNNAAEILKQPAVRKAISKHIDAIQKDDEREMDLTMTPSEELLVKDEEGNRLARVPLGGQQSQSQGQEKKGKRFR